ncbi:MYND-type domain-containing protein [Mycena chlorophos]|uniref:MYND-type domain-containing protein n=1 Tax=Mycena chlorophos TaxID=658473 RepID=A0A8H6WNC5_MYCCL|nr:MYND-type domain-containing protein [Mycena chlorophos]
MTTPPTDAERALLLFSLRNPLHPDACCTIGMLNIFSKCFADAGSFDPVVQGPILRAAMQLFTKDRPLQPDFALLVDSLMKCRCKPAIRALPCHQTSRDLPTAFKGWVVLHERLSNTLSNTLRMLKPGEYFAAQPALGPEEQPWPCCLEDIVPLCDPPKNPSERVLFLAITLCTFARFGGPSCHSTLTLMGSIARVHPEFGKALAVVPPTYDACLQHLNHAVREFSPEPEREWSQRGFLDKVVAVVLFFGLISAAGAEEDGKNTENFKYILAGYRERIEKFAAAAADVLRIVELPVLAARLPNKQAELEVVKGWCETIIDLRARHWKQKFSALFGKLAEVYGTDTCLFVECPDPKSKGSNLCSGCGTVRYCSKECQTKAWKYAPAPHSTLCKAIKKLRASPAVAVSLTAGVAEDSGWHGILREPHSEQCKVIVDKCVEEPPAGADSDKLVREIWSGAAGLLEKKKKFSRLEL